MRHCGHTTGATQSHPPPKDNASHSMRDIVTSTHALMHTVIDHLKWRHSHHNSFLRYSHTTLMRHIITLSMRTSELLMRHILKVTLPVTLLCATVTSTYAPQSHLLMR
jgi:hypothetical protein